MWPPLLPIEMTWKEFCEYVSLGDKVMFILHIDACYIFEFAVKISRSSGVPARLLCFNAGSLYIPGKLLSYIKYIKTDVPCQ